MPRRATALLLASLSLVLAGCSSAPKAAVGDPTVDPQPGMLHGIVLTEAIVPIANATVTVRPGDHATTTDVGGAFRVGPLEPGLYEVTAEADGYAPTTVGGVVVEEGTALADGSASSPPQALRILLPAVRTDVPYIEVEKYDAYLMCTVDNWVLEYQIIGAPCFGVIDLVTGQQVSQDQWQYQWSVTAPGLAGVLAEMFWEEQLFGTHMGMLLRNVAGAGSGVDAGGTNVDIQYASSRGPMPLRMWVVQGIENPGSDEGAAFQVPQNESKDYKLLILGRADNTQQVSLHLMVNNRPEVFLTKFYHVLGDPSYSVANA